MKVLVLVAVDFPSDGIVCPSFEEFLFQQADAQQPVRVSCKNPDVESTVDLSNPMDLLDFSIVATHLKLVSAVLLPLHLDPQEQSVNDFDDTIVHIWETFTIQVQKNSSIFKASRVG
ncbi:uncharacterized protein RAG0_06640 [Rhynchosporium agropyri]|uniref:Uncharacterized protein n=1 Tax=Rhynchosporium agropyri TaxID=914238 RepID=A0A1E1KI15_9HELO|nr:uncharacterized protein RAG0_06640 [Rhynchosporium agropyri]